MQDSGYRYARSAGRYTFFALLLIVTACFQFADAGLDEGAFDMMQPASPDVLAWAWTPNSTSDGDGTEYVAYLSTFKHAGPNETSVTTTATFRQGVTHLDLQGFVDWIVLNNAHVSSSADLILVKRVVTTVTLP